MAGLLVAIGMMGIVMSMVLPSWRTFAKREKETELVFRGEQYMRAIELYQRQFPGAYPTDLESLVEQKFLRRIYLDPLTGEPFEILTQGSVGITPGQTTPVPGMPGVTQQTAVATRGTPPTDGGSTRTPFSRAAAGRNAGAGDLSSPFSPAAGGLGEGAGGIIGVVSRSTEESLLEYNGRNRYNEWLFVYLPQTTLPGLDRSGAPLGGTPGLPGTGLGGRTGGTFPGIAGGPGVGGSGQPTPQGPRSGRSRSATPTRR